MLSQEDKEVLKDLWRAHYDFELRREAQMKEGLSAMAREGKGVWRTHFEMNWERVTGVVRGLPEVTKGEEDV